MAPSVTRKFGAPLFFCSFTENENEVILGGGGGSSSTGVANRLMLVDVEKNDSKSKDKGPARVQLEENPKVEIHTGDSAVISGAYVPSRKTIVCGMTGGETVQLYKLSATGKSKKKSFEKVSLSTEIAKKNVEIKVVTAIADGSKFAIGFITGEITVYQIDGLKTIASYSSEKASTSNGIMNLCFTPSGNSLVVVKDNGKAFYWNFSSKGKDKDSVELLYPNSKARTMLRGCHVCKEKPDMLSIYAGVNQPGKSFIAKWNIESNTGSDVTTYRKQAFAYNSAITVLSGTRSDLKKEGQNTRNENWIASGSSEGDVTIFCARTLRKQVKVQSAHMIFVTNLAFSQDGTRLVSVSADAGARITTIEKSPTTIPIQLYLAILVMILAYIIMLRANNA